MSVNFEKIRKILNGGGYGKVTISDIENVLRDLLRNYIPMHWGFNFLLVFSGLRKSMLFEMSDVDLNQEMLDVMKKISGKYDHIDWIIENKEYQRYLFFYNNTENRELIQLMFEDDHDFYLGKLLEFLCPGELQNIDTNFKYIHTLGINGKEFFAQVCTETSLDDPRNLQILNDQFQKYNKLAKDLRLQLKQRIRKIPSKMYLEKILNDKNFDEIEEYLNEIYNNIGNLIGYGLEEKLRTIRILGSENMNEIRRWINHIIFMHDLAISDVGFSSGLYRNFPNQMDQVILDLEFSLYQNVPPVE